MRGAADAGGRKGQGAGLGLGGGDQVGHGLPSLGRGGDQHGRLQAERNDGGEIMQRVIGQGLVDRLRGAERGGVNQDGVAVGRRLGHGGDPGGAARARPVLDDDRLAQLLRQLVEHDAPDHVVGIAGAERNDREDRPCGPGRDALSHGLHHREREHRARGGQRQPCAHASATHRARVHRLVPPGCLERRRLVCACLRPFRLLAVRRDAPPRNRA